ncbi:MAG: segregation/condensation protein A [candidate division Zixibacteria bacterium]|nr:segregation/condensation protein A [candidate division Zixibacteria bacterium]
MDYRVKLPVYEGPLDLLLFLIQKDEIDIYDIPISRITEQYVAYLELMQELNLALAGEFFVMAATLMEIKSAMLLPRAEVPAGEEMEDPRAALVARLLEYRKYKSAAGTLSRREAEQDLKYPAGGDGRLGDTAAVGGSIFVLLNALRDVLARAPEAREVVPGRRGPTLEQQIDYLRDRLKGAGGRVRFEDLFEGARIVIVITFLALLELLRAGECRVRQDRTFGQIWVYPTLALV